MDYATDRSRVRIIRDNPDREVLTMPRHGSTRSAPPGGLALVLTVFILHVFVVPPPAAAILEGDDFIEDLGMYQPMFFGELQDVELAGNRAYEFGVGGLAIFDISDLNNPTLLGRYEPPGHPYNRFYRGAVHGTVAYGGGREDLLAVIDITVALSPFLIKVHGTPGLSYEGADVHDNYLYAARHSDGIEVLDLADPEDPVTVAEVLSLSNAWDVAFAGDHAFVADGGGGLAVLNISDPTAPIHLGSLPTLGAAVDVDVVGDLAVVANGSAGIEIFDISDPTNVVQVGVANTSGLAITLDVVGDLVYVADWDDVEVFDISNPAAPELVGWENTPVRAMGLAANEEVIVVADWSRLRLYRFGPTTRADIDVSVTRIAFGDVPNGATVDTTFTVRNTGDGILSINEMLEFGDNFVIEPPTTFLLDPGESHEVTLSYTQANPGYDATFLRIRSNDVDEAQIIFPISADNDPNRLDLGEPAPEFTFLDIDGVWHSLSDYQGRIVVLAFFANW